MQREKTTAMCLTLDREAYDLMRQHAPTGRSYGRFLSRLVYEHVARVEERARLRETLTHALDGASVVKEAALAE